MSRSGVAQEAHNRALARLRDIHREQYDSIVAEIAGELRRERALPREQDGELLVSDERMPPASSLTGEPAPSIHQANRDLRRDLGSPT